MSGEKRSGVHRKRAGAVACGALLLAGLGGGVPLASQVTPPSAAVAGQWTWMSGSSTLGSGQGQSGMYGTLYMPAPTNVPGGRWGAPSWIDNSGHLWLFGGFGYASNAIFGYLNDLWEFNPSTNEWTWMGGSTTLAANYGGETGVVWADFKFVTAVIMIDDKPSGTPPDAEHVAQSELAYWARIADQL